MYVCMCVCMYVSHVLDRKLLERLMSPSPKSQVILFKILTSSDTNARMTKTGKTDER